MLDPLVNRDPGDESQAQVTLALTEAEARWLFDYVGLRPYREEISRGIYERLEVALGASPRVVELRRRAAEAAGEYGRRTGT